jgi:hypothetical protein
MAKHAREAPVPAASNQEEQRRLLKEATKRPGVAEAIEAYGRLARYGGSIRTDLPSLRYGTGGNIVLPGN